MIMNKQYIIYPIIHLKLTVLYLFMISNWYLIKFLIIKYLK